ncbi:MAG: nuclear transport factor 2 family protein [Gammaproteobacteria bacterium]|nr:nuclear transport factor 2 family protein [Gammaproteobacteria bacterium]MDH4314172.1 nuclear transport factor 2 family protein [Gammaproteobacteria bacterium]MDH5212812.1 nuclear transport factor 2 family protein [Gammaproteobacteria bacterium]MDH5500202.1 nuclear transport factor 2 family protein [Gammaproteobacteria bacterium]
MPDDNAVIGRMKEVFAAIDRKDTRQFVAALTGDAVFRFGSAPAVHGRNAIAGAVDAFFSSIAGCRHVLHQNWETASTFACEGEVTYRRHDGSEITLPFADVFDLRDDLISGYRIYIDIAPLYAQ